MSKRSAVLRNSSTLFWISFCLWVYLKKHLSKYWHSSFWFQHVVMRYLLLLFDKLSPFAGSAFIAFDLPDSVTFAWDRFPKLHCMELDYFVNFVYHVLCVTNFSVERLLNWMRAHCFSHHEILVLTVFTMYRALHVWRLRLHVAAFRWCERVWLYVFKAFYLQVCPSLSPCPAYW